MKTHERYVIQRQNGQNLRTLKHGREFTFRWQDRRIPAYIAEQLGPEWSVVIVDNDRLRRMDISQATASANK